MISEIRSWINSRSFVFLKRIKKHISIEPREEFEFQESYLKMAFNREINSKISENHITGDQIFHFGEFFFKSIPNLTCSAISGDDIDTLGFRTRAILSHKPKKLILSVGINSLLKSHPVEYIIQNLAFFIKEAQEAGVEKLGWLEILPLGNPFQSKNKFIKEEAEFLEWINQIGAPLLCRRIRESIPSKFLDIIQTRKDLAGRDGFLDEKFCFQDKINLRKKAYFYSNGIIPKVKNWFLR
jgi:hypothetical protein